MNIESYLAETGLTTRMLLAIIAGIVIIIFLISIVYYRVKVRNSVNE